MARCGMCFKDKELVRPTPRSANVVCKGCFFEIDRVVGYMESLGMGFQYTLSELEEPTGGKPPKPPKSSRKGRPKPSVNGVVPVDPAKAP